MAVSARYIAAIVAAFVALPAAAQACCTGNTGSRPPVVTTPTPPAPTGCAMSSGCGVSGPIVRVPTVGQIGVNVIVPGAPNVNVSTNTNVVMNQNIQTSANVSVNVSGGGAGSVSQNIFMRGGGSVAVGEAVAIQSVGPILAEGDTVLTETRNRMIDAIVPIRAVCMDDKGNPHPASQTFAGFMVPDGYDGEIFRCMAGTRMDATLGRMDGDKPVFDGAKTMACGKGEALVATQDGQAVCRVQVAKRPCNERSLLRRHGPGIKGLRLKFTEAYQIQTKRREVQKLGEGMLMEGGVGQGVY
jgi:hypothetical protein